MFRALCRSSSGTSTVFAASGLSGNSVPTQTALRAVSTSVCKPEAANTVEIPDDERHNARNMMKY